MENLLNGEGNVPNESSGPIAGSFTGPNPPIGESGGAMFDVRWTFWYNYLLER